MEVDYIHLSLLFLLLFNGWTTFNVNALRLATPRMSEREKNRFPGVGKRVFVTGATGMVGSALVRNLLDQDPDCYVGCLVRSRNRREATGRLRNAMARQGLDYDEARIEAIPGDVTQENLGIRMEQRQHGCTVDCSRKKHWDAVVHCAATIKLLEKTEVNSVDVMRHVVDFTASASLDNKPATLHYMSSVAACIGDPNLISIAENQNLSPSAAFPSLYGRDKYNAEVYLRKEAQLRNMDTYIYRAPFILPRSKSLQRHTVPDILLKLGILTRSFPRFKSYLPLCNLQSVSKSIAACVLGHKTSEKSMSHIQTLHLVDPGTSRWDRQLGLFKPALRPICGPVEEVTPSEFQYRMKSIQKMHHYAGVLRKLSPIIDLFARYDFPQLETRHTTTLLSKYGFDKTKYNLSLEDVKAAAWLAHKALKEEIGSNYSMNFNFDSTSNVTNAVELPAMVVT